MSRQESTEQVKDHQTPHIGAHVTVAPLPDLNGFGGSPYERIKAMILSNVVPPDTKVNIDKLARELGVSQTPVREALQRLEGDKLVVAKKPRGLWTTSLLDERELKELIEVRLLLEPWSARAVATDRATNPGREMLAEIERFVDLPFQENDGYALA